MYGNKQVLKNINKEIEEKEITAIIGPSGCGKSSLLRCINRMNELIPESRVEGEILFHNKNIYDPDTDVTEKTRKRSLRLWKEHCMTVDCLKKLRTDLTRPPFNYQGASSNGCALPGHLQLNLK